MEMHSNGPGCRQSDVCTVCYRGDQHEVMLVESTDSDGIHICVALASDGMPIDAGLGFVDLEAAMAWVEQHRVAE